MPRRARAPFAGMSIWSRITSWREEAPPPLMVEDEDDFVDFGIPLYARAMETDGTQAFHGRAYTAEGLIGFIVAVHPHWERWDLDEEGITLWRGFVSYRSTGRESDALLRTIARHYRAPFFDARFESEVMFTAIALNGNPAEILEDGSDMKLFYEPGREEDYAEIYTNIRPVEGVLQVREKDNDYRSAFLRALVQSAAPTN